MPATDYRALEAPIRERLRLLGKRTIPPSGHELDRNSCSFEPALEISKLVRRPDMKVSTLRDLIAAMGGELNRREARRSPQELNRSPHGAADV